MGIPIPPPLGSILAGDEVSKQTTLDKPYGNFDEVTDEAMHVPSIYESSLSTVSGLVLRTQLIDKASGKTLSDEGRFFVQFVIGSGE